MAAAIAGAFTSPLAWTLAAALGAAYIFSRGGSKSRHGGARTDMRRLASTPDLTSRTERVGEEAAEVTVAHEELRVDKHTVPRERVRIHKEVVTEEVTITVPVRREELRIERIPLGPDEPVAGTVELGSSLPDYEITLMHEVPMVDKQVVARERVRIQKEVVTEQRAISEELRREQVDVEQSPAQPETDH